MIVLHKNFLICIILIVSGHHVIWTTSLCSKFANGSFKEGAKQHIPEASVITILEEKVQKNTPFTIEKEYTRAPKGSLEELQNHQTKILNSFVCRHAKGLAILSASVGIDIFLTLRQARAHFLIGMIGCISVTGSLFIPLLPYIIKRYHMAADLQKRHAPTPPGASPDYEYYLVSSKRRKNESDE